MGIFHIETVMDANTGLCQLPLPCVCMGGEGHWPIHEGETSKDLLMFPRLHALTSPWLGLSLGKSILEKAYLSPLQTGDKVWG